MTTIAPYPFFVRYTGSPSLTMLSISGNLLRKSDTGLILIIKPPAIFYQNYISILSCCQGEVEAEDTASRRESILPGERAKALKKNAQVAKI
jgi:hypothetical protein